jgi:hypothetical protein
MQVKSRIKWLGSLFALLALALIVRVGFVIHSFLSQPALQAPPRSQVPASAVATTTEMPIDETPALRRRAPPLLERDMLHGGGAVDQSAPTPPASPSSQYVANEAHVPPISANEDIAWSWKPLADTSYTVNAQEVVARCDNKNPGNDQRSQLTISVMARDGNTRVSSYRRLWQRIDNSADDVAEKMLLYATSPNDARGLAFMRWTFTATAEKPALQWLYMPSLRKTRRVAVINANETFLNGDVAFADIATRRLDEDEHRFLSMDTHGDKTFFVIESVPKKPEALYSKRISWFLKVSDWEQCVKNHVDFYDHEQKLLKQQSIVWQQVNHAWIWGSMEMKNVTTQHVTRFENTDAKINAGISDKIFSESAMRVAVIP